MITIDNNAIKNNDNIIIKAPTDTIELIGTYPMNSTVQCRIKIKELLYTIPLVYKETKDEGNVFSSIFYISDKELSYYYNKNADCIISFIINGLQVEGEIKVILSPKLISNWSTQYSEVIKEIENLKQDIVNFKHDTLELHENQDIKKGMIPIATGVDNAYYWDYPNNNIEYIVKKQSEALVKISDALTSITNRVNDLEDKYVRHIHEEEIL